MGLFGYLRMICHPGVAVTHPLWQKLGPTRCRVPSYRENFMPKMKSHSGAKKRFKRTASGKFKMQKTNRRHLLSNRSKKRKRHLRMGGYVHESHAHQIARLIMK